MTLGVDYHWDPLRLCVVGSCYPPHFFDWVKDHKTRRRLQRVLEETEQDYQQLIHLLQSRFQVNTLRPQVPDSTEDLYVAGKWVQPPVCPRDYFVMIKDQLWVPTVPNRVHADRMFSRQHALNRDQFDLMDNQHHQAKLKHFDDILRTVESHGNTVIRTELDFVSGCFVTRLGTDLYFATQELILDDAPLLEVVNKHFPDTNNRIVHADGHGDAVYCPVAPGLIISLRDIPTYQDTFPDWEVVYLPSSNYQHMVEFKQSMKINRGRWYIPGFEQDINLVNVIEYYLDHWVGDVSETVFDVNILVVDNKNIIVSSHNDQVERACSRYGIDVHVSPFRHRYFWDAGIHCITNDLDRGTG